MKNNILGFILLALLTLPTYAQQSMLPISDAEQVKHVINELFDGYREGDSLRVKNTFTNNAMLQSAYYDTSGLSQLSIPEPITKFTAYIGGGLEKEHDERIWDLDIKINNNLASVWCNYAFYLANKFSHCGAENFLLLKKEGEWKIFHLVDTRQQIDCNIPDRIKNH